MILTLEVIGSSKRVPFKSSSGSIGRLPTSTLALDGDSVSRTHALIHYRDGRFYIEDRSSNGVSLNSFDNRLTPKQQVELESGNVIYIDPYEIKVEIKPDRSDPVVGQGPAWFEEPTKGRSGLTDFLDSEERPTPVEEVIRGDWQSSEEVEEPRHDVRDHDTPPIKADHEPRPTPPQTGDRVSKAALSEGGGAANALLSELLAGAGLDPDDVTPELAANLGRILHVVVTGVMDMLEARQQTKEEFRVDVTRFVRQGSTNNPLNNPLKFSTNARDALHRLLVKREEGYLGPVDAFEDAFEDLRHHQMATLAGVRQAFQSMLKQFDPEHLQEHLDRQQRGSLVPARLRYWDLYGEWFRDMVGDVDASFRTLFGEEFGEAYEEHLRQLKSQGRRGDPNRGDSF